ncbi:MAG: DUF2520 domain-containing protein [Flavobacteriales bacterium]|nr:DUF2520 domain-containing protein [Flavobacteriales bacterium]
MSARDGILLIGTGRLAFHLGHALVRAGASLAGIAGRHAERTQILARALRTTPYTIDEAWPEVGLYLLAVSDDAMPSLATRITPRDAVVAHTSGAQALDGLAPHLHRGVLWPVQSFSPGEPADLTRTPIVVDGNTEKATTLLLDVARSLSGNVVRLPLEQRRTVHLAAVFASNFPVFLLHEAQRLLRQEGLDPDILLPLWSSVAQKAALVGPGDALTGPARRGDTTTVQRHLDQLTHDADLRRAYALLSEMIGKRFGPHRE